jgi:tetratricopeptide (TPR) repeat protein/tRNA A-37 threonylcarbamoyl transferase component Bud32
MSEPLPPPDTVPADVAGLVAKCHGLAPAQLVKALRADQARRWRAGRRPMAEAYLEAFPALAASAEDRLVLIWGEVLLRRELGEAPQSAEYRARFPQHANALVLQFELESHLGGDPRTTLPARDKAPGPAWPEVPGYELLGELGRGGMGVVYKARQASLKRAVALKVLLAGAYAGPEQHARFRAEAEAVARLRHPNIVEIHEVGEHGGRPYLVLEYVEGGALDEKLGGAPQNPRAAAALTETLARAVHAAHQQGVVHRDLKPANVLLSLSGRLQSGAPGAPLCERPLNEAVPKIADFGLAKQLDAGPGRTPSEAILGTPSYMAPEQASGKMRLVGPAADVYALGAILYEMLTGRPPFRGETPLDTLQQVVLDEPVPPRALQPKVPADLDTVCLKCLQKDPGRRYASAGELADDLRRFLAGESIKARPVGPAARFYRWCRREPKLASLAAVLVLSLVGGLAATLWQLQRTRAAERAAQDNLTEANENLALARENLALAHQAVDDYSLKVSKDPRLSETNLPLRKELLQTVVPFYERLVTRRAEDPESRAQLAESCQRLAEVLIEIGDPKEAIARYEQARDVCARLVRDDPAEPKHRLNLARIYGNLGQLQLNTGDYAACETSLRHGLAICAELVEQFPKALRNQAELGESHFGLGLLHYTTGQATLAESEYRASLAIFERLTAADPQDRSYQSSLARAHNQLGMLFNDSGKYSQAEAAHREAIRLLKQVADSDPENGYSQSLLGTSYINQGALYYKMQNDGPAEEAFHAAAGIYQRLAEKYPEISRYQRLRANANLNLGAVYLRTQRIEQAEAAFGTAREILQRLDSRYPTMVEYKILLSGSCHNLALMPHLRKQWPQALDLYGQAIQALEEVLQRDPQHAEARARLHDYYLHRAHCRVDMGQPLESVPDWDKVIALDPGAGRDWLRRQKVIALARGGNVAAAVPEAEANTQGKSADAYYALACVCALASAAAMHDDKLPQAQREKRSEEYAARVVPALRQARAAGFLQDKEGIEYMKNDSDLASVRARPDFQQLLRELEKKPGP